MQGEKLRAALDGLAAVKLAVLFGSRARGAEPEASDFDVGVWLVDPSRDEWTRVERALRQAAGRPVALIDLTEAPPRLRFEIARDGRVIVEREPALWADFKARAMIDWWDWAPTARMIHAAAAARLRARTGHGPA
jgi:predicted nucleotidyltransferase